MRIEGGCFRRVIRCELIISTEKAKCSHCRGKLKTRGGGFDEKQ